MLQGLTFGLEASCLENLSCSLNTCWRGSDALLLLRDFMVSTCGVLVCENTRTLHLQSCCMLNAMQHRGLKIDPTCT